MLDLKFIRDNKDIVKEALKEALKVLENKGIESSSVSSLVTPSCGLGTLDEKMAEKIVGLVNRVSEILK